MTYIRKGFRLVSSIAIIIGFLSADVFAEELRNLGFEDEILDSYPEYWNPVEPIADSVTVVATDAFTNGDEEITVGPFRGHKMLRLGTPKQISEKQEVGENTVWQTFDATSDVIIFSFRLFSWEHRMDDLFRFDVCQLNEDDECTSRPYVVTDLDDLPLTCANGITSPCEIVIGDGKRGDLLDTGWVQVKVSGLDKDSEVRLEYSLIGGENNAHASWVYLDDFNRPPVANFSFVTNENGNIDEGSAVAFTDTSTDPDEEYGDYIASWEWTIDSYYHNSEKLTEQNPVFIFPDNDASYDVQLTVTDSFGASTTVSSGGYTIENPPVALAAIDVINRKPLVLALNQEVLAGKTTELFGRFVDPGWLDTHTVTWDIEGMVSNVDWSESSDLENGPAIPFVAIGTTTADYIYPDPQADLEQFPQLPLSLKGSLTITEDDASTSKPFTIKVLDSPVDREEGDVFDREKIPVLESGWSYLSTLDRMDDIDIFEVRLPDGDDDDALSDPIPAGGEVLVKLKNLPADFDLVVFSYVPGTAASAPWSTMPWSTMPWSTMPWSTMPWSTMPWSTMPWSTMPWSTMPWSTMDWNIIPWSTMPWSTMPWSTMPWSTMPWSTMPAEQLPLSELAGTELNAEEVSNSDISLSELGLGSFNVQGVTVAGFSANRGLEQESVWIRNDFPGTRIYVAVVGNNGAFSTAPYSLQVETSEQVDVKTLLDPDSCKSLLADQELPSVNLTLTNASEPRTLFVTQIQRFEKIHGIGSWASVEAKLIDLADNPDTLEKLAVLNIDIDSAFYNDWDSDTCSVEKANKVSTYIRDQITDYLSDYTSIEYVVFIGSDNVIPFRRVPDETTTSNEKLYVQDSKLEPGSPLFISMYKGYNLTDDYYVDNTPMVLQGRELYVPKLSVARLVETPDEIASSIGEFVNSKGRLGLISERDSDNLPALDSALVTGYDFFKDGASLSVENLKEFITDDAIEVLNSDTWNMTTLRCGLGLDSNCASHDINNVNAHYNHYSAITAFGFNLKYDDPLFSEEILSSGEISTSGAVLSGSLNYTVGCHSGLSVPDNSAIKDTGAALDFPQAMSRHNTVYVGNTGFGLGETTGVAGTEQLLAMFSAEIAKGGTVGQALVRAKTNYFKSLSTITVYDEKSSIQSTMYGLPMYKLDADFDGSAPAAQAQAAEGSSCEYDLCFDHVKHTSGNSSYYTVNQSGEQQITAWRPIQPKVVQSIESSAAVHGVLITEGAYTDTDETANPVISRPKQEWEPNTEEPQVCLEAFWPSTIASINTIPVLDGVEQSLIVVPGQFRCTSDEGEQVTGIQRNITSLTYELTEAAINAEFTPPTIKEVDLRVTETGVICVDVDAVDDGGIDKMVLLVFDDNLITSHTIPDPASDPDSVDKLCDTGPYTLEVPADVTPLTEQQLVLQVVDNSGNVATWNAKGVNAKALEVIAEGETPISVFSPTTLTGTIVDFDELAGENDIFYRWEFGDEKVEFGKLVEDGVPVYGNVDGSSYSFTVDHQYTNDDGADELTATLKITDSTGYIGVDDVTLEFCADPVGDIDGAGSYLDYIACDTANSDSGVTIILRTADFVGDNQFRIHLDLDNDGKDDETLKYNNGSITGMKGLDVTAAGQLVTFTFDLPRSWDGTSFQWYAETQEGVSGGAGQGFVDRMPDAGYFTHTMK